MVKFVLKQQLQSQLQLKHGRICILPSICQRSQAEINLTGTRYTRLF